MIAKRPCVILVADSNMAATFRGYFKRDGWHLSLGCTPFEINTEVGGDLIVDEGGNDPGVYTKGHELLRPYQHSHQRALVVLDCEWEGSPRKAAIVEHITARLVESGWAADAVKVIAIEPELENWLWQDKPQVAEVLRYKGEKSLRQHLADNNWWPVGEAKPPRPKEAAEWMLKQTRQPRSSAIYQKLAERISIKGCTDNAFAEMHAALRGWFPTEVAE
jgi:phenylpyruvate tautomerase PptA (4-oxalocrotonate tautomerase family)